MINEYDLEDYEDRWGYVYNMFHRQSVRSLWNSFASTNASLPRDMHEILQKTALSQEGDGMPCRLHVNHRVRSVDHKKGSITFESGKTVKADLIIGSDGIRSSVRPAIGIE